ncbi:ubiquinone biosynthesis protein COQ4 homolog, mitochondrial-like [Antedon mediterranea]|uniref:ubiquinone biosynthesis protein COQ4 homolog, mitochondrial-like n=1 Tax=Antedon mediterranea TaxID=105859 RepID=UPI003AF989A2
MRHYGLKVFTGETSDWYQEFNSYHIPTTKPQNVLLSIASSMMALYDPYRHDMVAVVGEATGYRALQQMHRQMMNDPTGQIILKEKPRINSKTIDFDFLRSLPDKTLGKKYITFMDKNNINADTRAMTRFVDDADLAYVIQRYRELHDFNHLLLGLQPNMLGEVLVKWFEMIQTGFPVCTLGAIFGPIRLDYSKNVKLMQTYLPLVIKAARKSTCLLNVYIEHHFEDDFEQFRDELGIRTIPIR